MEALKALAIAIGTVWTMIFLISLFNARPKFTKHFHAKIATICTMAMAPCFWTFIMVAISEDKLPWIIIAVLMSILTYVFAKSKLAITVANVINIDDRDLKS